MAKDKSKPTLEDIAELSGVSVATVSRVINNSSPVSKDLEIRVKQAMEDLGVERKHPKTRTRPYVLAFVTSGVVDPTSAAIIHGAQEEANRLGLCLVVIDIADQQGQPVQNIELFKHLSFDGLILDHARIDPDQFIQKNLLTDLPVVVISRLLESPRFYCINSDRESGMYQATKYLLSLNHRNIAYIGGNPDVYLSQSRLQGVNRALEEVGLTLHDRFYRWGNSTIDDGFQLAISILSQNSDARPTAIIAFNDLMAIGAMHAIRTFGLSVPEDLSVVGFNETYFTPHTNPPLTTVSQPKYREGQLAIQKIHNHIQGHDPDKGGYTLLECPLVVRESTGICKH